MSDENALLGLSSIFLDTTESQSAIIMLSAKGRNSGSGSRSRSEIAQNYLQKIIQENPTHEVAIEVLHSLLSLERDHQQAFELAEKLVTLQPLSPIGLYLQAKSLFSLRTPVDKEAMEILEKAAQLAPKNFKIQSYSAQSYLISGNATAAIAILKRVLSTFHSLDETTLGRVRLELCKAYVLQEEWDEAYILLLHVVRSLDSSLRSEAVAILGTLQYTTFPRKMYIILHFEMCLHFSANRSEARHLQHPYTRFKLTYKHNKWAYRRGRGGFTFCSTRGITDIRSQGARAKPQPGQNTS